MLLSPLLHSRLPYRIKKSLIKRCARDVFKDYAFEREFFGMRYPGNAGNVIDRQVLLCGAYEKYMLFFLRDYIREQGMEHKAVMVDVGANVGNHALFLSQHAGQVHAFEPYQPVRAKLDEKLRINGVGNVRVFPCGLGEQDATLPFYAPGGDNEGIGSFREEHSADNTYAGELEIRHGDTALQDAGIKRVDILKVDVEGFERPVLEGLKETIARDRPLIIFEMTETTQSSVADEADFTGLFPEGYGFQRFARANRDTGAYRLVPYRYGESGEVCEVVASTHL